MLSENAKGLWSGVIAYSIWGILPIYWKMIAAVPATQILAHRIIWSFVCMLLVVGALGQLRPILKAATDRKILGTYLASALLVGFNWGLFIWAVNQDMVLQASLGYFIAPLVNVIFGRIFLKETLSSWQTAAVGLMFLAVAILVISAGQLPWVALLLALSFCSYGLIRKTGQLGAMPGLLLESALLTPLAITYLFYIAADFPSTDSAITILLVLAGPATALPLVFFAIAAKRLPLKSLGMLQYLSPSGQFLLGVLVYNEPLSGASLLSFSIIWFALAVYLVDTYCLRAKLTTA